MSETLDSGIWRRKGREEGEGGRGGRKGREEGEMHAERAGGGQVKTVDGVSGRTTQLTSMRGTFVVGRGSGGVGSVSEKEGVDGMWYTGMG